MVEVVADRFGSVVGADLVEGVGASDDEELLAVGGIFGFTGEEGGVGEDGVLLQGVHVHLDQAHEIEGEPVGLLAVGVI